MSLFMVEGFSTPPSLEAVAERLGIPLASIDQQFGVVLIDHRSGQYCVQIIDTQAPGTTNLTDSQDGPWSSPPITEF